MDRRSFLSSAGAAATLPVPAVHARPKRGTTYRTALIGAGWWGMNLARVALAEGRSELVAVCDVDADQAEISADEIEGLTGTLPRRYRDYRELLEKESIEIAIIATPDHWHALQTIAAIEAGAHVHGGRIGPNVTLEADAVVESSEIRDAVVGSGTRLESVHLHDSLVGADAHLSGLSGSALVADHTVVEGSDG